MSWSAARDRAPLVAAALVILLGVLLGGWLGSLAATAGVVVSLRVGPRPVAALALAALLVAAIGTVGEQATESRLYSSDYAFLRPVASRAALVAGVLSLVAIVMFALKERARSESASVPAPKDVDPD